MFTSRPFTLSPYYNSGTSLSNTQTTVSKGRPRVDNRYLKTGSCLLLCVQVVDSHTQPLSPLGRRVMDGDRPRTNDASTRCGGSPVRITVLSPITNRSVCACMCTCLDTCVWSPGMGVEVGVCLQKIEEWGT